MKDNSVNQFFNEEYKVQRRRKLLPWWIKVFCWFFMFFGLMSVLCLMLGFVNFETNLSIYGLETNISYSILGMFIIAIGLLKGLAAYMLWFEKDLAIKIGKMDAIIGIIICCASMFILPFFQNDFNFSLRLELVLLIPFLLKLNRIESVWNNF